MFIITATAYGDFDERYDVLLASTPSKTRAKSVVKYLNDFCKTKNPSEEELRLYPYLNSSETTGLHADLSQHIDDTDTFIQTLKKLSEANSIYAYATTFDVSETMDIQKGIVDMKKYYYDFGYFFSRKDSGSIRVTTTEPLDTDDTDNCIAYALKNKLIEDEYADNIVYISELTEEEARDMGFEI